MDTFVEKEPLILREYGRNVQKLVQYITTLPSVEERTQAAHTLINLMKQLNPSVREHNDNMQRIWDHLHHMANFNLDINSPYPKPTAETIFPKPKRLEYNTTHPRFRHYGKNVELLVEKALLLEDAEEKLSAVQQIMRLMKSFYSAANNDNIEDEVLLEHIRILSKGKLHIAPTSLGEGGNQNRNQHKQHQHRQQNNPNRQQGSSQTNNGSNKRYSNDQNRNDQNRNRENNPEKRNNPNYQPNKNFKKK
jgi:hypothetical protein